MSQKANQAKSQEASPAAHEDDLIVVPKGTSRLRFILILALTIFVLVIFTVGDQVQSGFGGMFGGGGRNETYMTWTHPDSGETYEIDGLDFQKRMQALDRLASVGAYRPLEARTDPRARVSSDDVAMYYINDRLASDAGIDVSDGEFRQRLRAIFGTSQVLQMQAGRLGTTTAQLESDLREVMRGEKFRELLMMGISVADADAVREKWDEAHPEFSFEYTSAAAADFEEEARTSLPDDETLLAWYRELPINRQRAYYTEDKVVPELATVALDAGFDGTALLAKYPPGEDVDPETQARSYYNLNSHIRFQRPQDEDEEEQDGDANPDGNGNPDGGDDEPADENNEGGGEAEGGDAAGEGDGSEDPQAPEEGDGTEDGAADEEASEETEEPQSPYLPFEEVLEICKVEAPLNAALSEFMRDLKKRAEEGEEVDFAAEATALGLTVVQPEDALSRTEIEESEGWGGRFIAGQLMFAQQGAWLPRVVLEERSMIVGRIKEKRAGAEPPIDEMRDALLDEWVKDRSKEVAVEKLEALRDAFGDRPAEEGADFLPTATSEEFAAAVTGAGFEVQQRDYLERLEIPGDDFDAASPADLHIRGNMTYHGLEAGQVPAAVANAQGDTAFLVRLVDSRPAPMSEIKPAELMRLRQTVVGEARSGLEERAFSPDSPFVRDRYKLTLYDDDDDETAPVDQP